MYLTPNTHPSFTNFAFAEPEQQSHGMDSLSAVHRADSSAPRRRPNSQIAGIYIVEEIRWPFALRYHVLPRF
jgi:hypothetical protein